MDSDSLHPMLADLPHGPNVLLFNVPTKTNIFFFTSCHGASNLSGMFYATGSTRARFHALPIFNTNICVCREDNPHTEFLADLQCGYDSEDPPKLSKSEQRMACLEGGPAPRAVAS